MKKKECRKSQTRSIIFMGMGSKFSTLPLETLIDAGSNVCLIVQATSIPEKTQPSVKGIIKAILRPPYRFLVYKLLKLKKESQSIAGIAAKYDIPVLKVTGKLDSRFQEEIKKHNPDLICIASFNQLIKKEVIQIPQHGVINFHPSLLPYYPGPNPWFRMIMNNETKWGATIHYIDEGEDTGDIICQSKIDYSETNSGEELFNKVVNIGAELMVKAVGDIFSGEIRSHPQSKVENHYRAPRPKFGDLIITFKQTAEQTYYFLRRLLFFVNPIIKWQSEYYQINKIKYSSNMESFSKGTGNSKRLVSNILKCYFDDGLIELQVTPVQRK